MRYWVRTPKAHTEVALQLGTATVAGQQVDAHLWLIDWDPRQHPFNLPRNGTVTAQLLLDGDAYPRQMRAVRSLPRPHFTSSLPDGSSIALSPSTDHVLCYRADGLAWQARSADAPGMSAWCRTDDSIWISHQHSSELLILSHLDGSERSRIDVGGSQSALSISDDGKLAAIALSAPPQLVIIDTQTHRECGRRQLPSVCDHIIFNCAGDELAIHLPKRALLQHFTINDGHLTLIGERGLGRPVRDLLREPDQNRLWATSSGYAADVHDLLGNHQVAHELLRIDWDNLEVGQALRLDRHGAQQQRPGDIAGGTDPAGLAWHAGQLLVVCSGSRELVVLDPHDVVKPWQRHALPFPDFRAPGTLASCGDKVAIADPVSGSIGLLDLDSQAIELFALAGTDTDLAESDPRAMEQRCGETSFWASMRSGISCQSCHSNSDTDHAMHAIGQHVGPTLSVRGLAGTTPYLHGGGYRNGHELYQHLGNGLLGGHREGEIMAGAIHLDRWLDSLALPVNPRWHAEQPLTAGWRAFKRANCTDCHMPPVFTDHGRHREAHLFSDREQQSFDVWLDTPSLRQTWRREQRLRDGRASSLRDLLLLPEAHGNFASLTHAEQEALINFVESL